MTVTATAIARKASAFLSAKSAASFSHLPTARIGAAPYPFPETPVDKLSLWGTATRYDRWGEGLGVERLHQESFQQAWGIAPDAEGR